MSKKTKKTGRFRVSDPISRHFEPTPTQFSSCRLSPETARFQPILTVSEPFSAFWSCFWRFGATFRRELSRLLPRSGARFRPPLPYMALKSAQLTRLVMVWIPLGQPIKKSFWTQFRLLLQYRHNLRPMRGKWVLTCSPGPFLLALRGQQPRANVLTCRLSMHLGPQCSQPDLSCLLILHS